MADREQTRRDADYANLHRKYIALQEKLEQAAEALELAREALEAARDRGDKFGAAAWRGGIVATLFALDVALAAYEQEQDV